jgi:hypothetical protein
MIRRIPFITTAIIASAVITACSDPAGPGHLAPASLSSEQSSRSGTLHVEKECSQYTGQAGSFCTITSSTLEAIKPGTRVIYASAAVPPLLDTDLLLDPPGDGNTAFGHVVLDIHRSGLVTISVGPESSPGPSQCCCFAPGRSHSAWTGRTAFSE